MGNGREMEELQGLSLLELVVLGNSQSRILKDGDGSIVHEHAKSQVGDTDKLKEFRRCILGNVQK